ncbi:tRNA (adenosine(37)-N6)-dimethylallyltransferase MiaA [Actinomyces sp. 594]|uniref:tRNA (adenosine(37)-N6)-dimethylallyltransferase MiaA n=1 Tax=Actinomyces sp. 594 TaxID=2057793 RepID=UPI001C567C28|nr:tRNA (adenosine(37)-N6)-dimethylallyltransferase MiaA [Actinomyces sp. 594]MBW3069329.1 tRNA (adenosine(37)-N6)-dimethylallyltransferase MiaA [Actinomyces sp. 594]
MSTRPEPVYAAPAAPARADAVGAAAVAPEGNHVPVRVAVVGPTASGKSALALDLADALGGGVEMLNADAFQLYRGMDIGTAKLGPGERRGYPHHQLDVLDVHQEASVAAYQAHARADIRATVARGNRPVIVGGSGLYVRAVTDALDFPGTNPGLRAALEERARQEGTSALWRELHGVDPAAAERIDPGNTRRIVRALEVVQLTGRPFTATLPRYADLVPTVHLALRWDREVLDARINARAEAMFASGLLEETEVLLGRGLREGPTARRAIGYAQAIAVLDGAIPVSQAVADTAAATRKLASRQLKWFRRDPRVQWLDVVAADGTWAPGEHERVLAQALQLVQAADRRGRPEGGSRG